MFIIINVFFFSKPKIQGEYKKEIQTLDYDFLNINLNSSIDDSQARPHNKK
jgi:hypothetical protein